jgi:hypothetical protein
MMTGALTPCQALAYLRELSPSVRAAAVAKHDGTLLAGEAVADAVPPGCERIAATADAVTVVAIVAAGAYAALARGDAKTAVAAVRGRC